MFAGENGLVEKFMLAIFDRVPVLTCDSENYDEDMLDRSQVRSLPWSPAVASICYVCVE